jgi:hypothetical protein
VVEGRREEGEREEGRKEGRKEGGRGLSSSGGPGFNPQYLQK